MHQDLHPLPTSLVESQVSLPLIDECDLTESTPRAVTAVVLEKCVGHFRALLDSSLIDADSDN